MPDGTFGQPRPDAGQAALLTNARLILPPQLDRPPLCGRGDRGGKPGRRSFFMRLLRRGIGLRMAGAHRARYLLRTNLTENDPAPLWQYYIQLVVVEQAFKSLKGASRDGL
jgi:hypothetical protein